MDYYLWKLIRATVYGHTYTPVQLTSFTADRRDASILLRWSTAQEIDNMGFEVQRRRGDDSGDWTAIGFVPAATESSSADYFYEDGDLPAPTGDGQLQYRLKQIDYSGETWYSPVQHVTLSAPVSTALHMDIAPMPVTSVAMLQASGTGAAEWNYSVFDLHGRQVAQLRVERASDVSVAGMVNLEGLPAGTYMLVAHRGDSRIVKPFLLLR